MRKVIKYYGWFKFLVLLFRYFTVRNTITVPGIRNKITLRRFSTDQEVFKKIFLKLEYSFNQIEGVKYIVDAGAYTGLSAIFFRKAFPDSKIVCVEASHTNFTILQKNTQGYPNMVLVNMALWNESTWLNFSESKSKQFGSRVEVGNDRNSIAVRSITIDDLMKESNMPYIDLLKIDIEGSEKELFLGEYAWLKKVRFIVIELHDRFKPGSAKSFFKALDSINYSLHLKGENILIINHDFSSE